MAKDTAIQWTDGAVNPTMGCDSCEIWGLIGSRRSCYAGVLHERFPNAKGYAPTFEEVTNFPGRMAEAARWPDLAGKPRKNKPWLDGLPRLIFVSDMSDSLSRSVTFEYLRDEIIANVAEGPGRRHQWQWLTKRPARMAEFSLWLEGQGVEWPANLWAGTSITTQATTSRIKSLLKVGTSSTIRFVSVEPQIESIDLEQWLPELSWVIQGGESGQDARPFDVEWAEEIAGQCGSHGTSYFLKQLGSNVVRNGNKMVFGDRHAGNWTQWPVDLRIRQMPVAKLETINGR
jgi:protein gp37